MDERKKDAEKRRMTTGKSGAPMTDQQQGATSEKSRQPQRGKVQGSAKK